VQQNNNEKIRIQGSLKDVTLRALINKALQHNRLFFDKDLRKYNPIQSNAC
jgi:hypothetical protein